MKKIPVYTLQTISCKPTRIGHIDIVRFEDHLKNIRDVHFPHRHDFYYLLYVSAGRGTHTIDFQTYRFAPGQLYIMSPGQVHEWEIRSEMKGYVVSFTAEAFYNDAQKIEEQWSYFHSLFYEPLYLIDKSKRPEMEAWFEFLYRASESYGVHQAQLMKNQLSAMLYKIADSIGLSKHLAASDHLVRRYELLLDGHFSTHHELGFYAEKLHITPNYLNSLCKKEIGKSAKTLLSERLLLEARRLLRHSRLSVGEIADHLQFQSPSYFIRFFKKHGGLTPLEFRAQR